MAQPPLDPTRYRKAWLVDPSHTLPMGPTSARLFSIDGEIVDTQDLYWRLPLADGSLTLTNPRPAPEPEPEAPAADSAPAPAAEQPVGRRKRPDDPAAAEAPAAG